MRVLIAMMKHETNTFSPIVTDWARFEAWGAHTGLDIQTRYADTRMPIAAYMRAARARGASVVTPLAAEAMPSGRVKKQTFEYMADLVTTAVANGCDAALFDLHGAMAAEHTHDGEGTLLQRVRTVAPGLPIAVTCDLHCNLSKTMIDNATAIIGYKTYPHVDMYEVAEQVAEIVLDFVAGKCTPTMAFKQMPLLSQTLCQGTDDEPMRSLIEGCKYAEKDSRVLAATAFGGFALADVPDAGNSVVVITNDDPAKAASLCDELTDTAWKCREQFVYEHRPLATTLEKAKACTHGPTILLDHADNCGSGATQDVMTVVKAVLDAQLEDVIVAAIWDPLAVAAMQDAGVGATVKLALGGKTDMPAIKTSGRPLEVEGVVRTISDGTWTVRGPMYTGMTVHMGPTAVLDTGSMKIVVVSNHHEPWDQGVFRSVGIEPENHRYILLKSRIHYRAGFAPLAQQTFTLDGVGVTTSDNTLLDYEFVRRPIYPLDLPNEP